MPFAHKNNNKAKQKQTQKSLPEPETEPGSACTTVWSVTFRPPSKLNKPSKPDLRPNLFFNKVLFSVII